MSNQNRNRHRRNATVAYDIKNEGLDEVSILNEELNQPKELRRTMYKSMSDNAVIVALSSAVQNHHKPHSVHKMNSVFPMGENVRFYNMINDTVPNYTQSNTSSRTKQMLSSMNSANSFVDLGDCSPKTPCHSRANTVDDLDPTLPKLKSNAQIISESPSEPQEQQQKQHTPTFGNSVINVNVHSDSSKNPTCCVIQ